MGGKFYYGNEEILDYEKAAEFYTKAASYGNVDGNLFPKYGCIYIIM